MLAHERTIFINKDRMGGLEIWPSIKLEQEGAGSSSIYLNHGGEVHDFAESSGIDVNSIPTQCVTRFRVYDELAWCLFGIEF